MLSYKSDLKNLEGLRGLQHALAKTHAKVSIEKALNWFSSEIGELKQGISSDDKENVREELTQCLIWCLSIANILGIDLSKSFDNEINHHVNKYPEHYLSYTEKNK